MKIKGLWIVFLFVVITGCAGREYRIPQPDVDMTKYHDLGPVTQTASGVHLFQIIPIGLTSKIERAIKTAIMQKGGDTLKDIVVKERWYWAYVLNIYKVDIEGTVIRKK